MGNLIFLPGKFLSQVRKDGLGAALNQTLRYLYWNWCRFPNTSGELNSYESTSLPRSYGMPKPVKYIIDLPPSRFSTGYIHPHVKAKFIKEIYELRPWYHDFEELGIQTNFPPEKEWKFFGPKVRNIRRHAEQQPRKTSVIKPYTERALRGLSGKAMPSILDIFCSDGYYSCWTKNCCKTSRIMGVDINKYDVHRARIMAKHLGFENTEFVNDDVVNYIDNCNRQFDIIINAGGLYHLSDPENFLESLRNVVGGYMVVQSAITVKHNDPYYFESPRPGLTYGSWFTHARLERWLDELGYYVIDSCTNERQGENPEKIGASYFLVTPKDKVDSVNTNI